MQSRLAYKIQYPKCSSAGLHQGQNLNIICLHDKCNYPVICSFCKIQNHQNHQTKTLKHYLENVINGLSTKKNDTMTLEIIEQRKEQFILTMKQGIEELAGMFKDLELVIISIFDKLKDEFEKKKLSEDEFVKFYKNLENEKMISDASTITTYLNSNKKLAFPHIQKLFQFFEQSKQKLKQTSTHYTDILQKQFQVIKPALKSDKYNLEKTILPENTTFIQNRFTHKKENVNNVVFLYNEQDSQMFKLALNVIQKPEKLYLGLMTHDAYKSHPKKFDPKVAHKEITWVSSDGNSSKCKINTIQKFDQDETIFMTLRKDQLVVKKKTDNQFAILLPQGPAAKKYFFIAMQGNGKLDVVSYQYNNQKEGLN